MAVGAQSPSQCVDTRGSVFVPTPPGLLQQLVRKPSSMAAQAPHSSLECIEALPSVLRATSVQLAQAAPHPQLSTRDAPPHPPLPCSTQWRQLGNLTAAFHLGPLPQGAGTAAVTCARSHPHVSTAAQHPRIKVWFCFNRASCMRYSEEHPGIWEVSALLGLPSGGPQQQQAQLSHRGSAEQPRLT